MPFTSIYPIALLTQSLKFLKKYWEFEFLKNSVFLWVSQYGFFSQRKPFFFFIPIKISQGFLCSKDWSKFWWLSWFPAKKTHSKQVNWLFTISKSMDDMEWPIRDPISRSSIFKIKEPRHPFILRSRFLQYLEIWFEKSGWKKVVDQKKRWFYTINLLFLWFEKSGWPEKKSEFAESLF